MLFRAAQLQYVDTDTKLHDGRWVPARSLNYQFDRWLDRIKWAWLVFIGRYDAVDWEH